MASVTVRVEGLRELGERMRKLSAKVSTKLAGQATGAAAQVVKKADKRHLRSSPSVDSGLVEKNVIVKKLGKSKTKFTSEHIVTIKKVVYPKKGNEKKSRNTRQVAGYLEFGTVNMAAEPHLRPAFNETKSGLPEVMKAKLAAGITKAGA